MKSCMEKIAVFVVLNLAMGSFAVAMTIETGGGDMVRAKLEMEAAEEEMEAAKKEMEEAGRKMKEAGRSYGGGGMYGGGGGMYGGGGGGMYGGGGYGGIYGSGGVLVIPSAEIKTEDIVAIMEDMNVMSRILDKKLVEAHMISNVGIGSYGGGYGGYGYGRGGTEGIFLEGYGALFLMKVNFPLLAPPQAEEKEQTEEPGDRVWEETKREIYSMEDVRTLKRRRSISSISITRPTKKFDAEKVEELRRKLIKTLKHATNIQNLKPDEWVIVTVIGAGSRAGIIRTEIITGTKNQVVVEGGDKRSYIIEAPLPPEVGYHPGGVLIIRVKKSDVDAFAAGEMDFDKFREEAQIFTY